ncbi:MAG: Ribonuclease R [Candidatus Heimdallarchaeota archaeon LC_3]|nr:MAG: Ribonuclease R [Candidatus Heimdallarchaeota archaeon LC_3]
MPLNREQVAKQVINQLKDIKVTKVAYFPKKIVLSGQTHISRKNQLLKVTRKLSKQFNWDIVTKFIFIDGNINEYLIDKIIEAFPQRYDIEKINIDLKNKKILVHCFYEPNLPKLTLDMLKKVKNEFKITITLIDLKSANSTELSDLITHSESFQSHKDESVNINSQELENNILNLLPKWIKDPEIILPKNLSKTDNSTIILEVNNDFTDLERIKFLQILLESQIGYSVKIQQNYDIKPQLSIAENLLKEYLTEFEIKLSQDGSNLNLSYSTFPLSIEIEKELQEKILKKSKFNLILENNFDSQPMDLSLKEKILELAPEIEYAYVYFNTNKRSFNILYPEEATKEINIDSLEETLQKEFLVKVVFSNIEENPTIYLKERILKEQFASKKVKKIKFDSDKKKIEIHCINPITGISEEQWKKILLRLSKFDISFLDIKKKKYHFVDFPYYQNLDQPDLIDLLFKILPIDLDIKSVNWYDRSGYFLIKYYNLLLSADFLNKTKINIQKIWNINIFFQGARDSDELISSLKIELPEWILQPKITTNDKTITLVVENDYTDEDKVEEFCDHFSQTHFVPIILQFNLSVSRIKYIVMNNLREHVDVIRVKIYPEKNQIYLEGVLKRSSSSIDDDIIQEALDNIEERTKYIIEAYIKTNKAIKGETVHDILTKLNESYVLTNDFSSEVMDIIDKVANLDIDKEIDKRLNLCEWDSFSIDSPGTRIIDDLISIQRLTHDDREDEYLLGVHIADVDHFIGRNSILDDTIRTRGLSMYVGEYFPMIPEQLIKKISLDENKERLAVTMLIEITLEGEIVDYWIKKSVVRNKKQFNFDQVNEQLMEHEGDLLEDLQILVSLTYQLRHQRIERGSFNLDIDFVPNDQASQIVSEIMILANRLMGFYMQGLPGQKIFRNQHIPSYAYVSLAQTLELYGYKLDLLNKNPLVELNEILSEASQKNEQQLIFKELRRYLSNAYYSHNCYGYESLGTHFYTHWTSPLRRYIDIVVARLAINNDSYIDNLIGICQYQSALERFSKIKSDNYAIQLQVKKINKLIDKPLLAELYGFNRKQIVFLLKDLNAYATIRLAGNPGIILMEGEDGLEFQGEFINLGKEIFLQIVDVNQEKRDIFLRLGLLEKLQTVQKHHLKAKLTFLS